MAEANQAATDEGVQRIQASVLFKPPTAELRNLPEGPYLLADGRISWVAIEHGGGATQGSLNILDPATGVNESRTLSGRPGFAFPTEREGVFVVGMDRAVGLYDWGTHSWTPFVEGIDAGVAEKTRINDGVI